jgi:2'-5' RNA ligase
MCTLQSAVELGLEPLGFRGENRRYTPHITLGRAGRGDRHPRTDSSPRALAAELATLADYSAGTMFIDEVAVVASLLTRQGPEYRVLSHAPLA